jgi:serine/threonine-protein kinase
VSEWLEPVRKALAPRYQVDRVLGQGGMGTVFLARDTRLECPVAVKVLAPQLAGGTATVRFLREARLSRR